MLHSHPMVRNQVSKRYFEHGETSWSPRSRTAPISVSRLYALSPRARVARTPLARGVLAAVAVVATFAIPATFGSSVGLMVVAGIAIAATLSLASPNVRSVRG